MKTNVFIQARMSSSRLPGKVLETIVGKPMLLHIVERLKHATLVDKIVVLTSDEQSDDIIKDMCENWCGAFTFQFDEDFRTSCSIFLTDTQECYCQVVGQVLASP